MTLVLDDRAFLSIDLGYNDPDRVIANATLNYVTDTGMIVSYGKMPKPLRGCWVITNPTTRLPEFIGEEPEEREIIPNDR